VEVVNTKDLLEYSIFANCILSIGAIALIRRRHLVREFAALAALLVVFSLEDGISLLTLFFRKQIGLSKLISYDLYFYSHQICFFLEYGLLLLVIYSVFHKAMKPLEGLHSVGKIIFRWVCAVSLALAIGIAAAPHSAAISYIGSISGQIQQGTSILILCLLLFVCFSTRLLGLTCRSHIFGVTLGLGVYATAGLIEAAWYVTRASQSLYSPMYLFSSLAGCVALLTWGTYFAMPEPERKMILLPTTSPFFLWNRISEALGDEPGFVAIAGFKPEMLAPAELTVLTAASNRLRDREAEEAAAARKSDDARAAQHAMSLHPIAMNR
jgi:hypothetical protein